MIGSQSGRQIKAGEFTFQLWDATSEKGIWNEGQLVAETTNKAPDENKAIFTFDSENVADRLTFAEEGRYLFIVKEVAGTNPIIGYDETEYNLMVDVAVQDDPETEQTVELNATVYLIGENNSVDITDSLNSVQFITFENMYNDTEVEVDILKELFWNGAPAETAEGFEFVIEDENGKVITDELISNEDGAAGYTFRYDEEDIGMTYTYKVYEKAGDMKGMEYDDTIYTVVVVLSVEDGAMRADVTVTADDVEYDSATLVFTNRYTSETPYVPDTGDNTGLMTYASMFAAAVSLLGLIVFYKKKKINN